MRVLIVDDEPAARSRLAALIEEIDPAGVQIVGEAGDGVSALDLSRERAPDVILLDIAMREIDGFDVARHLAEPRPLIIFQTAYSEYALQAFEHDALDYVVKPVRRERLAQALERARARIALRPTWDRAALDRLGVALGHRSAPPARLLVRHGAGHRLVRVREITRVTAADGLVRAQTRDGMSVVDYTVNELEVRMGGAFARVSRADLVNIEHVRGIASKGDGSATLTLSDGALVRVSRRRSGAVRRALEATPTHQPF